MLDDIKADETDINRSSVMPWVGNVGETESLDPAFEQNTYDDEYNTFFMHV